MPLESRRVFEDLKHGGHQEASCHLVKCSEGRADSPLTAVQTLCHKVCFLKNNIDLVMHAMKHDFFNVTFLIKAKNNDVTNTSI